VRDSELQQGTHNPRSLSTEVAWKRGGERVGEKGEEREWGGNDSKGGGPKRKKKRRFSGNGFEMIENRGRTAAERTDTQDHRGWRGRG
jgi:hypothetical protein